MATPKRIQIEFDLNTNDVKIASEATLTLAQQVRILKQELQKTQEGTKEFEILKNKLNETKDNFERVNVKSRELFGTLSLIPGPIGEIAGKLNGAVSLLKVFSGFSLKDIQGQFKALGEDLKSIINNFTNFGDKTIEVKQNQEDYNDVLANTGQLNTLASSQIQKNIEIENSYIDTLKQKIQVEQQYQSDLRKEINAIDAKILLGELEGDQLETAKTQRQIYNQELQTSIRYQKSYVSELENATKSQGQNTTATGVNTVSTETNTTATLTNAGANQTDATQKGVNTIATRVLTVAQNAATVSARLLTAALLALPFVAIFVGISALISKIGEYIDAKKAAKNSVDDLTRALERQKQLLDDLTAGIDAQVQIDVERAKQAGKSEAQIYEIRRAGLQRILTETRNATNKIAAIENDARAGVGRFAELSEEKRIEVINKYNAEKQALFEKEIQIQRQIELEGEREKTRIAEEGRKKRDKNNDDAAQKALERRKAELDAAIQLEINKANTDEKVLKDLLDKRLALEKLSGNQLLLAQQENGKKLTEALESDEKDRRALKERSINAIIEREEAQSEQDVERLKQLYLYRRDFELQNTELILEERQAIIAKYDKIIRDLDKKTREDKLVQDIASTRGNFDQQIELYRQFAQEVVNSEQYTAAEKLKIIEDTNAKIEQFQEERLENEKTKLDLSLQQGQINNQKYFNELITLYDKEIEALKLKKLREEIVEADFNKRLKALTDARNKIKLDEKEAQIALIDAIGNGFSALSNLVGEQTKQGKALAVAATLINTYAAIAAQLRASASGPSGAIPGYAIAQAIATGIFGLAQVRKILATPVPGSSGGGSGGVTAGGVINVTQRRAQGGMITGSGGEFSDNIPAMLSNGEFVMNARSTRVFRPLLESMNAAANLPRFAVGGMVNQGITPPKSQNETLTEAISSAFGQTPIRTYVTATEVSNQQQFDRIIKSRSLI